MGKMFLVLLFGSTPFFLFAQSRPMLAVDSSAQTSEFYAWTYDKDREEHGYWGSYWMLDYDYKLYAKWTHHHPVSNTKTVVGNWQLIGQDSILLSITKPKKLQLPAATELRYRIFKINWKTNTGFTLEKSGDPLTLTSFAIFLSDNPAFSIAEFIVKLNEYFDRQPIRKDSKPQDESDQAWDQHDEMEKLIRQYCNRNKVIVGIKQYRNNMLWAR